MNVTFPTTSGPPSTTQDPGPTPTPTPPPNSQGSKKTGVITLASLSSAVLILAVVAVVAVIVWYQRRHKRRQTEGGPDPYYDIAPAPVSPFMTTVPRLLNKIGRGKFAVVYKGKLPDRYEGELCFFFRVAYVGLLGVVAATAAAAAAGGCRHPGEGGYCRRAVQHLLLGELRRWLEGWLCAAGGRGGGSPIQSPPLSLPGGVGHNMDRCINITNST